MTVAADSVWGMTAHSSPFRFARPGALIAALPAVLGFVPEKSLVVVSLERGRMGAVLRADLSEGLESDVGRLAEVVGNSGAETAVAVIVDADGALCPMCNADYQRLSDALASELDGRGVGLSATHVVDRVDAGGSWHCVDGCGAGGLVDDPVASPLAAAAVLDGRRLYARRADLQAVVSVSDPARAAVLKGLLEAQTAQRRGDRKTDPDGCGRRDVEAALAAAARVAEVGELSDAEIVAVACGLVDGAVRDTLYALAVGVEAARAEALWALLARTLPDPWRNESLVLLAFSSYVRGDGPLAGLALEAALRSDPEHRMAGMLDTALQSGLRPEQIRKLANTGYRQARRLGVRLPARRAV